MCTSGSLPLCGCIVLGEECRHRTGMSDLVCRLVKAKFHYTSWFEAGSKLVRSQIPLRYLVRTSFEPASVIEFGHEPASSC